MTTRRYLTHRLRMQQLRVVDALAAQGSLLKASSVLGVSQPALSKTLHEIEDILQLRLFERHARGVRVTPAGAVFVRSARSILAELRRVDEELETVTSPEGGSVSIGALPVAASGILPGVLSRLKAMHPAIRIDLRQGRSEDLQPLLAAGEIDLIVGRLYEPAMPDGFRREKLWSEPMSILARAGHPLLSLDKVSVEDLQGYELVLPTISQRVGQEIEHLLDRLGVSSALALRSSSHGLIRELLHETDAISLVPKLMMLGDLLRGTLAVVPLPIRAPDRPAGLVFRRDRPLLPPAQAFEACLRTYVADIVGRGL